MGFAGVALQTVIANVDAAEWVVEPHLMNASPSQLEQIATRAHTLYSRPTVAMELVKLAEQPRVDARALKQCVEQDPALACKILRVVNSSLFGLNRPVADLNQAIGLLGIKPLKLLVLGFSLPDELFAEVAADELRWYWTNTLTRAVSARLLSEQLWRQPGDEAFIAGLLQDIGILVLVRELGAPYTRFLAGTIKERCCLAALEQDTLKFDHTQLSAALLGRWHLPQRLVDAIAVPKLHARLARLTTPEGDLPQILYLAELLVQLVGQRRLGVLGDLLEAGKVYRGMTKAHLATLVKGLQPQVDQLADVLSLELTDDRNYVQTLVAAHEQMATLSEEVTASRKIGADDDRAHNQLLAHTRELTQAMNRFLSKGQPDGPSESHGREWPAQHAAHGGVARRPMLEIDHFGESGSAAHLHKALAAAVKRCRERRRELSLLLVEPNVFDVHSDPHAEYASRDVRLAILQACSSLDPENVSLMSLGGERTAAVLSHCDRRAAVVVAQNTMAALGKPNSSGLGTVCEEATTVSIGVATASVVPRNFDPVRLVECAERCLSAARACGISTVKSIEV
jgi:HD-like signal output (HDOD) protein/GGDEF domain-containing protein